MLDELIDVLDEEGNQTGRTAPSSEIHAKGLWHRVAHVWFTNSKGQVLLQRRGPNMTAYPNHWDISAAGHIPAGESSLAAARRETEEELGLSLFPEEFELIFQSKEGFITNNGSFVANEIQDVYLVHKDIDIDELVLGANEVTRVQWVSLADFEKMARDAKTSELVPHPIEYPRLIEHLSQELGATQP